MTDKEALKILTTTKVEILGEREEIPGFCEAINIAVAALQKQIPKETLLTKSPYKIVRACPVCRRRVFMEEKYCVACGQALTWEEEDDDQSTTTSL